MESVLDAGTVSRNAPETARNEVQIRQIMGSAGELTTEVLRLLVSYPYDADTLDRVGIRKEDMAAHLCRTLPAPGGALYTADDGSRLRGLLYLAPQLEPSAMLGSHIWRVELLVIDPDAPDGTVGALLEYALSFLDAPVDYLFARVPADDHRAVQGLHRYGFNTSVGEAQVVARTDVSRTRPPADYDFVPLDTNNLDAAAGVLYVQRHCNPYLRDPGFNPGRIRKLTHYQLRGYREGKDRGALVAVHRSGTVVGLAAHRRDPRLEWTANRTVAGLDSIHVRPEVALDGLDTLLAGYTLACLHAAGVEAVTSQAILDDKRDSCRLDALKEAGFEVTGSNLVLGKWINRPHSS